MATEPFIHETAVVEEGASVGDETAIWHWVHVCSQASLGRDCTLGQNVYVGPGVEIGDEVSIQNNVSVYEGVTLEDEVFCGPSVVFTNVTHPRSHVDRSDEFEETHVGRGATLGANATIVCGTTLGAYCFVGAGTVVTADVPPHALMVGNPARRVGWVCVCGQRLPELSPSAECERCGREYELRDERLDRVD